MKKIKKNKVSLDIDNLAGKLSSYAAMAGAFVAFSPEISAQCTVLPQVPGDNLVTEIDINGDGIVDAQIQNFQSSFQFGFINTSGSLNQFFNQFFTTSTRNVTFSNSGSFFYQNVNGSLINNTTFPGAGAGFVSVDNGTNPIGSNQPIPDGNFQGSFNANTINGCSVNFALTNAYYYSYYTFNTTNRNINGFVQSGSFNSAYALAGAGNQIVGLSVAGGDVCALATATGAGLGSASFFASDTLASIQTSQSLPFLSYDPFFFAFGGGTVTFDTCGIYTGAFGGVPAFITAPGQIANTLITDGVPPNVVSTPNINTTQFLAVQFLGPDADGDANPDTYNGWVQISIDPNTSAVSCVASGYQECSVEVATAAGDATLACINVGDATNESAACAVVCDITSLGLAAGACVDPGAPADDPSDDTFVLTIDPVGTTLGTNFSYDIGAGPVAGNPYGTAVTVTLPADGAMITVVVTDETDTTCTLTEMIAAPAACSVAAPCTPDNGLIQFD